jgi:glycosyltransferase involved in cell wall biosynthesis
MIEDRREQLHAIGDQPAGPVAHVTRGWRAAAEAAPQRSPLRILLINYRYFVSGGPERYLFNLIGLLESQGHAVVPFSIDYEQNEPSEYARHFAPPLGGSSEVYFKDHSTNAKTVARSIERAFYSPGVYRRLASLIAEAKPDVALVLHYLRKLSPSVLKCLADHHVPFAVRLSDFGMICPSAHLLRDGRICELCVGGNLWNSVRYRCVQGSLGASAVNFAATQFHRRAGYFDLIRTFVVPSRFTIEKMVEGGWDPETLVHVPTFVSDTAGEPSGGVERPPVVVYAGRIERTKGVHVLLEAVRVLRARPEAAEFTVRVLGSGDPEYLQDLKAFAADQGLQNVRFEGSLPEEAVRGALRAARCSVAPSLWYENMPNAVLDEGTPVVASDHGSFPELVQHEETGLLVPPDDAGAIADALSDLLTRPEKAATMGERATSFVAARHSPARHYERLMQAFEHARQSHGTNVEATAWT